VLVDVLESAKDLKEDALDNRIVKWLVVSRLHQLVEITIHVLHSNVQFFAKRVEEDVICRHKVRVGRDRLEEDYFSEVQTLREGIKSLLHGLDSNLSVIVSKSGGIIATGQYQSISPHEMSASAPCSSEDDTSKAAIANIFDDLEFVLEAQDAGSVANRGPAAKRTVSSDSHVCCRSSGMKLASRLLHLNAQGRVGKSKDSCSDTLVCVGQDRIHVGECIPVSIG
jgi:hypothetical protein